jgi:hypothetical protein
MNTTLALARFWGIILVILCVSMLINAKFYVRLIRAFQDESLRFLYFFVVMVIGAVNVSVMNQWQWDVKGLIMLLGWGSLLKGSLGILLPDFSNKIIQKINLSPVMIYASGVIVLIVGGFLLVIGFIF